jgi:hypothetical protein
MRWEPVRKSGVDRLAANSTCISGFADALMAGGVGVGATVAFVRGAGNRRDIAPAWDRRR